MSNKKKITLLMVVLLFVLCPREAAGVSKQSGNLNTHDKDRRVVFNSDQASCLRDILENRQVSGADQQSIKKLVEDMIDEHAKAKIDTYVYCVFGGFQSCVPSKVANYKSYTPKLDEAGFDFLKVIMDRCRHNNMRFMASLRMNDRHGGIGLLPKNCTNLK